jgi:hypothetical protein
MAHALAFTVVYALSRPFLKNLSAVMRGPDPRIHDEVPSEKFTTVHAEPRHGLPGQAQQ